MAGIIQYENGVESVRIVEAFEKANKEKQYQILR